MPSPTLALEPAAPSRFGRTRSALRDRFRGAPGPPPAPGGITVGAFLESWLTEVARGTVRPRTYVSYRYVVDLHLVPRLGDLSLAKLSPSDVQAFLNAKAAAGLSPRTRGRATLIEIARIPVNAGSNR